MTSYIFVSGNFFYLFLYLPCRLFPWGIPPKSRCSIEYIWVVYHPLWSAKYIGFDHIHHNASLFLCNEYQSDWNYLLPNWNWILLVQWKVLEHELDCLFGRSQEPKINSQFYTEIIVNNERDKVCRILPCSNTIYLSAIWPTMKVCGGIELQIHTFLTLAIRMGVQLYSLSAEVWFHTAPMNNV